MGIMYSAVFENVAVTVAQDFFEINAPTNNGVVVHAVYIGQASDAGDAEEELLRIRIIRGHTTSGSGGSAVTPTILNAAIGTAFGGTVEANNTTVATAGTPVTLHVDVFNIRSGWVYLPTPEMRPTIIGGSRLVVNLPAAPADSLTMSGTIVFEVL